MPNYLLSGRRPYKGTMAYYMLQVAYTPEAIAGSGDTAVVTITVKPTVTEYTGGEWEAEADVQASLAIEGTGTCEAGFGGPQTD